MTFILLTIRLLLDVSERNVSVWSNGMHTPQFILVFFSDFQQVINLSNSFTFSWNFVYVSRDVPIVVTYMFRNFFDYVEKLRIAHPTGGRLLKSRSGFKNNQRPAGSVRIPA